MSLSCYVYYRVRAERMIEAEAMARAVIRGIESRWPVSAHLAKRVDEPLLWMEVYQRIPVDQGEFVGALNALVADTGLLATMADGERRHVEIFECV